MDIVSVTRNHVLRTAKRRFARNRVIYLLRTCRFTGIGDGIENNGNRVRVTLTLVFSAARQVGSRRLCATFAWIPGELAESALTEPVELVAAPSDPYDLVSKQYRKRCGNGDRFTYACLNPLWRSLDICWPRKTGGDDAPSHRGSRSEPAQQSISMKATTPGMDSATLDGQVQPIGSAPAPE
jgi:hypothetical protein